MTSRSVLSHPDQLKNIANGTMFVFVATIFGLGLNYVYSICLARFLGAEQFGLFTLGLAVYNLLSVIAVGGLDSAVLKFIPGYSIQGDEAGLQKTCKIILVLSLIFGLLFCLALLGGAHTLSLDIFKKPEMTAILMFFAFGIPLFTVSSILVSTFQAFQQVRWRLFVKYVCEPGFKVLLTTILMWAGWNLEGALTAFLGSLVLTLALTFVPLRHLLLTSGSSSSTNSSVAEVLVYATPLLWSLLFASIANRSDILLLGYWASASQVGVYSAAFQTSAIMALVLQSFESTMNPLLSERVAKEDTRGVEKLCRNLLRWVFTLALPLFLMMILFSREALSLFGANFESGSICLVILAFGQLVNSATGSANNLLLMVGRTKLVMWNSLLIGLVQIGLNLILIPQYGIVGAALATTAGHGLVSLVRVIEGFLLLGIQPYERTIYKPLVAGVGAVVVTFPLLKDWMEVQNLPTLVAGLVLTYAALLVSLGLEADDRAIVQAIRRHFTYRIATQS